MAQARQSARWHPRRQRAIEVIAHRGASAEVAEHTFTAYERAIAEGADALECDVRLTADGHLVCVHDRRINRTSDGDGPVSTKTLQELDERDFGSWKAPSAVTMAGDRLVVDEGRRRVLTLDRLIGLVVDSGHDVGLTIEAKHPTRYAGLVEQRIVEVLQSYGLTTPAAKRPVRVMSFSQLAIRRMRALAPALPSVFLMDRVPLRLRNGTLPFGARVAGPSIDVIRAHPEYVARAHAVGNAVHVWTVDDPRDLEMCKAIGVDAVITNRPALAASLLGDSGPSAQDIRFASG